MARAGVICLVGAVFGTLAGVIPGVGLVWMVRNQDAGVPGFNLGDPALFDRYPLTIPWPAIAIIVIGAPVLATIAAAALTRARLPSERRGAW